MPIGLFLRRERITSVRRGTAFSDRLGAVVLMSAVVLGCLATWDWNGWDRSSVAGAARFAFVTSGMIAWAAVFLALGVVPMLVAPLIASERDRKSLDSLLATPLHSAEIVLGTMGAGLLRYANAVAGLAPVLILVAFVGGIDHRVAVLVVAGLASTVFALTALSTVVNTGASTAAGATSTAAVLAMAWMGLPHFILLALPGIWPAAARGLGPVAVRVLDSTPIGVAMSVLGVIPRGPLVVSVPRMIAYQTPVALLLVAWAIARLRPASRAVYDEEGRAVLRRILRARWRSRPACGDDPVLWHEIYPNRGTGIVALAVGRAYYVLWMGLLAYVISWFAVPAFAELYRSGYGPSPGTGPIPALNPFARAIASTLQGVPIGLVPGEARLEFNVASRQTTGLLHFLCVLIIAGAAAECVVVERERQTWLGLIATPLSGLEILRAKMVGAVWWSRGIALPMFALWVVGVLAGAVHPVGFLAASLGVGVSSWFLAALGVSASLRSPDRGKAACKVLGPLALGLGLGSLPMISPGVAGVVCGALSMPFQTWIALLSYEDVDALLHARAVPQFAVVGIHDAWGSRLVLAVWLTSTAAQAVGAFLLTRSAARGFDAACGRPARGSGGARRPAAGGEGSHFPRDPVV